MDRPTYLSSYNFNWETLDVILSGKSSLDAKRYMPHFESAEHVHGYLNGYGFDMNNPVEAAELFGNFQEAIQFIKRYFLKEGNPDGLEYTVPNIFYTITDISELFLMVTGSNYTKSHLEESIWAGIILKVMHTILHADKDLRYRYFSTVQTQIFDRFYKYLHRDSADNLFLKNEDESFVVPLFNFETKSKKTRESIIIKLLHKQENVAEEVFDRIGIRFVANTQIDVLRIVKFLYANNIIVVNNIKPSRSINTMFNLPQLKENFYKLLKQGIRDQLNEKQFIDEFEKISKEARPVTAERGDKNTHTASSYRAVHFTCRQLIKYKNPFMNEFSKIRRIAKKEESELAQKILALDTSSIASVVRFFYPYEVQITDKESYLENLEGSASHEEYKKSQLKSAMHRIFKPLIEYNDIKLS
jgi:uncharacterized protein (TIGR04562 family)